MVDERGVLLFVEANREGVVSITRELLTIGRPLASELDEELSSVLIGCGVEGYGEKLFAYGSDRVYVVDDPLLEQYQPESYVDVMVKLCSEVNPRIIIFGHTSIGWDLAPRLAYRVRTSLATDCVDLSIDPNAKKFLLTRYVHGGNIVAVLSGGKLPQIATIRPRVYAPAEAVEGRVGEVVRMKVSIDPSTLKVKKVGMLKEEAVGVKIEDAEVIIAGGRGVGAAGSFKDLEKLANILRGAVACSKAPVDAGWMPSSAQVGITGKTVAPKLYIAIGISGAMQHMIGCARSHCIVAINTDAEAPIFKYSQFGIVGDYRQILPHLIEEVKKAL